MFCFDWLGQASSSHVKILTFSEATTGSPTGVVSKLQEKFLDNPEGTVGGLTIGKLKSAAWLTTQMTPANISQWNEMHVALWNIFWDAGIGSPALPNQATYGRVGGVMTDPTANAWYTQAMANSNYSADSYRVLAPVKWSDYKNDWVFDKDKQVFMGEVTGQPFIVTPEPGTYALMGAGLLALGIVARRKRSA